MNILTLPVGSNVLCRAGSCLAVYYGSRVFMPFPRLCRLPGYLRFGTGQTAMAPETRAKQVFGSPAGHEKGGGRSRRESFRGFFFQVGIYTGTPCSTKIRQNYVDIGIAS